MRRVALTAVVFIALAPADAFAYLDPGAGSYILQLGIAFLFASLWAIKSGWRRIAEFLRKAFTRSGADLRR